MEKEINSKTKRKKWPLYIGGALIVALTSISPVGDRIFKALGLKQTNSDYISEVAEKDKNLSFYKGDKTYIAEYISKKLKELDHINRENYVKDFKEAFFGYTVTLMNTPSQEELNDFNELGLIKIYYLLNALSDVEFRKQIGTELELDTRDTTGEHGGALYLEKSGKVVIEMIPNEPLPDITIIGRDTYYNPKRKPKSSDLLYPFHFHARGVNEIESSALSPGDFYNKSLVFTRVGKNEFNVDVPIFFKKQDRFYTVNLDLGVYSY